MAVIEYMLHRVNGGKRKEIPGWVGDRGHWMSPIDGSFIGWVDDVRDYYVPDTVVSLSKQDLIDRQLAIHAVNPMMGSQEDPEAEPVAMTDEEVSQTIGAWYDEFVTKNGAQ